MAQVSFTEFRANLARFFDEAEGSRAPLLVTRTGRANMVLLSEEEFEGWRETVHLLSNPRNAARLLEGIKELDAGLGEERALIQPATEGAAD
jgi:antitoxin YefM